MKFVKITSHNEAFFELLKQDPKAMAAPLKAHVAWLKEHEAAGKLLGGYYMPGNGDCVTIWDFENEAEFDRSLLEDPMGFTFNVQIHAGVPLFEHIENALKTME